VQHDVVVALTGGDHREHLLVAATRKSTTTGRSLIESPVDADSTSSGASTRMPTQPIDSAHFTKSGNTPERFTSL